MDKLITIAIFAGIAIIMIMTGYGYINYFEAQVPTARDTKLLCMSITLTVAIAWFLVDTFSPLGWLKNKG